MAREQMTPPPMDDTDNAPRASPVDDDTAKDSEYGDFRSDT